MRISDWSSDVCSSDLPFGGGAARLLLRGRKALGAQPVDRGFHVAAAFGQRLLAIHHARAAAVTKLLHGGGGDLGPWVNSSYIVKWMRAGKGVRPTPPPSSEERRVGKEGVSTCRARG